MHITLMDIFIFVIAYIFILGIWQFIYIRIHKKGYELEKKEDESFFDFMCRYYEDSLLWKLRKKYAMKWIYNSKVYERFIRLKGIISVLIAILMLIAVIWLKQTDYYVWLDIEL